MERLVRSCTIPSLDELTVWAIFCFTVRTGIDDKELRRHSFAASWSTHASRAPGSRGVPDTAGARIHGTAAYVGTTALFEAAGFDESSRPQREVRVYPVGSCVSACGGDGAPDGVLRAALGYERRLARTVDSRGGRSSYRTHERSPIAPTSGDRTSRWVPRASTRGGRGVGSHPQSERSASIATTDHSTRRHCDLSSSPTVCGGS
jgi:hypothetical protein